MTIAALIRLIFDAPHGMLSRVPGALLLLLLPLTGLAQGTPAGTTVSNQAQLSFEMAGAPQQALSNNSTVSVQELIDVSIVWQDAAPVTTASPSLEQVLTYRLLNTGNGIESFALGINNSPPGSDDFDPLNPRIYFDGNNNNSYDGPAFDPLYTPGSNDPLLDANGNNSVVLFVLNDIPGSLANGESGDSRIIVQSTTAGAAGSAAGTLLPGLGDSGADAVVGSSNAITAATGSYQVVNDTVDVTIAKSAEVIPDGQRCSSAPCEPVPGATIRYTLQVDVSGTGTAENLLITDSIPANTRYTPASITLDSTPLTDIPGDDPGSFSANLVSVELGNITSATNFVITLDVTIN
jgi:uncharacterized repeat protein (TIGR01451 family)